MPGGRLPSTGLPMNSESVGVIDVVEEIVLVPHRDGDRRRPLGGADDRAVAVGHRDLHRQILQQQFLAGPFPQLEIRRVAFVAALQHEERLVDFLERAADVLLEGAREVRGVLARLLEDRGFFARQLLRRRRRRSAARPAPQTARSPRAASRGGTGSAPGPAWRSGRRYPIVRSGERPFRKLSDGINRRGLSNKVTFKLICGGLAAVSRDGYMAVLHVFSH